MYLNKAFVVMTLLARTNPKLFLKSPCQELSESMIEVSGGAFFTRLDSGEQWGVQWHNDTYIFLAIMINSRLIFSLSMLWSSDGVMTRISYCNTSQVTTTEWQPLHFFPRIWKKIYSYSFDLIAVPWHFKFYILKCKKFNI